MPAFNAGNFIEQSIKSVLNQTFPEWELIVIDDGSTDNTASVIKKIAELDERVKYVYQNNSRQGKARNRGIQLAKGEYLAFLDADDIWVENKLELQLQAIESEGIDLVFSDFGVINEHNTITNQSVGIEGGITYDVKNLKLFFEQNRIPILTVLTKRSAVEEAGLFSENLFVQNAEDYHLWLSMLLCNKRFCSIGAVLAYYRVHSNQITDGDYLSTGPALNALVNLRIKDEFVNVQRQSAVYRWLLRYHDIYSRPSNHVKPVYRFLSKNSFQFKIIKGILPLVSNQWKRRIVVKFCRHKLSLVHE